MTDRARIDEVRKVLLDSFMADDITTYTNAVLEMERLIGADHGDRNPKANGTAAVLANRSEIERSAISMRANAIRWGRRSLNADVHDDGGVTWSVKYPRD